MKKYIENINKSYSSLLNELEHYVYYCLRCLHRGGIYPQPKDFVLLSFKRNGGNLAEAVVYPATAVKNNTIENPLFFYGFKCDWNFTNLEKPVEVTFSEKFEELLE